MLLAVRPAGRRCWPARAGSGRLRFDLDVGQLLVEEIGWPEGRQTA